MRYFFVIIIYMNEWFRCAHASKKWMLILLFSFQIFKLVSSIKFCFQIKRDSKSLESLDEKLKKVKFKLELTMNKNNNNTSKDSMVCVTEVDSMVHPYLLYRWLSHHRYPVRSLEVDNLFFVAPKHYKTFYVVVSGALLHSYDSRYVCKWNKSNASHYRD